MSLAIGEVEAKELTWIPSLALDQRFDDNFRLRTGESDSVAATRLIGNLDFNTKSERSRLAGLLRVDALLNAGDENNDELSSNQIGVIEAIAKRPRSEYGVKLNFKQDTPNRDIAADITDIGATASEVGTKITQDQDVDRKRLEFNPTIAYNLSRRTELQAGYTYTSVDHGTPSCEEALNTQFFSIENLDQRPDSPLDLGVFTPDELDDFEEHLFEVSAKHKLSLLDSISTTVSFSQFTADEEIPRAFLENQAAADPDDAITIDSLVNVDQRCINNNGERNVVRNPRSETGVDTSRLSVGYEKALSETLDVRAQLGYYIADSKAFAKPPTPEAVNPELFTQSKSSGSLFNITLTKKTAVSEYSGRIGIEVFPSSVGDVVESFEFVANLKRSFGPRTVVNFRVRAFEPREITDDDAPSKFSRRFLSIEPKIVWNFSRTLTLGASYRYRREKLEDNAGIAQSNAVLFSIKYTPPSKLADLENQ